MYVFHEGLYRPIRVKCINRFSGVRRPTEQEVFDQIRHRPWFLKGRQNRLGVLQGHLDRIIDNFDKYTAPIVRFVRHPQRRAQIEEYLEDLPKAAK
ncbi:hypothetical protein FJY63_09635 [Candidatus Sumerlaeota bacterium]|nr:hypothetical protein [Candidatus Sumerlaeota bacterium]